MKTAVDTSVLLDAVVHEIEDHELRARLAKRKPVDLARPAARTVVEVHADRERELGG